MSPGASSLMPSAIGPPDVLRPCQRCRRSWVAGSLGRRVSRRTDAAISKRLMEPEVEVAELNRLTTRERASAMAYMAGVSPSPTASSTLTSARSFPGRAASQRPRSNRSRPSAVRRVRRTSPRHWRRIRPLPKSSKTCKNGRCPNDAVSRQGSQAMISTPQGGESRGDHRHQMTASVHGGGGGSRTTHMTSTGRMPSTSAHLGHYSGRTAACKPR